MNMMKVKNLIVLGYFKNVFMNYSWEEVVEQHFAIQLPKKKLDIMAADEEAVDKLRQVPANWSIECEEALVRLMSQHIPPENDHLGSIKNYVEAVDVTSCCVSEILPKISSQLNTNGQCMLLSFGSSCYF